MSFLNIVTWIAFGALAGWLAGLIMNSKRGLVANVILGVIGSFVGGWVAGLLGIDTAGTFSFGALLVAVGGACLVTILARFLGR